MTYTSDNRLATYDGISVQYDADGNMISGPLNGQITAYTFNSRNQLTAVGTSSYTYDAEGNRIAVNLNGIQYTDVINPNAALSQLLVRTGPETQIFYVYGLGLIGEQNGNDYKVYHYDLRGSTVLLTNLSGATTDSYQYGPYGELLNHTGSSNTQFLYNGRDGVMTDGNGLYYMRARYYNPEIQRFVSRDSLEGSIADSQSLNRYAFVRNNPLLIIDPLGKWGEEVHYNDTLKWATETFNNKDIAKKIATADQGTDFDAVTNPGSPTGQKYHFNTTGIIDYLNGETRDSREIIAEEELNKAVNAYLSGKKNEAYQHLGIASHCVQDMYAHFDSLRSPYSVLGIKHHIEILDLNMGYWDDPLYDWNYDKGGEIKWCKVKSKEQNNRWLSSRTATLKLFNTFKERVHF